MSSKKHATHPQLTGEHKWDDREQGILIFLFLAVWITDSFVFHLSTFQGNDPRLFESGLIRGHTDFGLVSGQE